MSRNYKPFDGTVEDVLIDMEKMLGVHATSLALKKNELLLVPVTYNHLLPESQNNPHREWVVEQVHLMIKIARLPWPVMMQQRFTSNQENIQELQRTCDWMLKLFCSSPGALAPRPTQTFWETPTGNVLSYAYLFVYWHDLITGGEAAEILSPVPNRKAIHKLEYLKLNRKRYDLTPYYAPWEYPRKNRFRYLRQEVEELFRKNQSPDEEEE